MPLDKFHFLTRIHYKSANVPEDGKWGEHEIDYVLFIQSDVDVNMNENEVKSYRYVSKKQLQKFLGKRRTKKWIMCSIEPWMTKTWIEICV